MGSAPSPPAVPQASDIAQAQSTANINSASAQAALNNVNQVTPYGNLTYAQTGTGPNGIPTYSATQTLGQGQQSLLNTGTQLAQNIAPQYTSAPNIDPSSAVNQASRMFQNYMQPYFNQQNSTTMSNLRNQGFVPGDTGYDTAMTQLQNEQGNLIGNQITQFEPQAYSQALQSYELPLQTAENMISPTQAPFTNTPQTGVSPTDVTGAYNTQTQAQEYNYGQQMQNYSAMMGGLFSIPASLAGGWAKGGFPLPGA